MKIKIEKYEEAIKKLPEFGQQIIGHQQDDEIVVYQAYKPSIAAFAIREQYLGGSEYGYGRMSWIKPNFLWMMYRCGWAEKENQERVLALWINKKVFEDILNDAVFSSYNNQYYNTREAWQKELSKKEVRLQWDPDHDPHGNKLTRRAIQLGLKGNVLASFGKENINVIEDITEFVRTQYPHVKANRLDLLEVPKETIWMPNDQELIKRIGINPIIT